MEIIRLIKKSSMISKISKVDLKMISVISMMKNHIPPRISTTDQVYQHLKDNPDHIHHEYFMKLVGSRRIEQIRNNEPLLSKYADFIFMTKY